MKRRPTLVNGTNRLARAAGLAAMLTAMGNTSSAAQRVWTGTDVYFEKPDSANWSLPEHQDRITGAVWITRANRMGIFNIAQESSYTHYVSPLDTEWATGSAENWQDLTFQAWEDWVGGIPLVYLDVDAVVHLVSDDIYVDIRFVSWTPMASGGGFAYWRAGDPAPLEEASWGRIKAAMK